MSFYTSLNGLKNAQIDLGVISHNIANAETTGFKKMRVEFADIVVGASYTKDVQGIGATVESVRQNFSLGPLEQTGNVLDLAINGEGFFTTRNPKSGQTLYTRNGLMQADGSGFIADASGNRLQVLATQPDGTVTGTVPQDVVIPPVNAAGAPFSAVGVNNEGQVIAVYADGSNNILGTIAMAGFFSPQGLTQVGSSNWAASANSGLPNYGVPDSGTFGDIITGAVERSNVDIAEELVGLITAQRNFQANAKAIDAASQISQTIINLRT